MCTFLDDHQVQNGQVGINNAPPDRLAFAFSLSPGAVARVALAEQQTYTPIGQNALLHGEPLLIVSSADAHYVALQEIGRGMSRLFSFR